MLTCERLHWCLSHLPVSLELSLHLSFSCAPSDWIDGSCLKRSGGTTGKLLLNRTSGGGRNWSGSTRAAGLCTCCSDQPPGSGSSWLLRPALKSSARPLSPLSAASSQYQHQRRRSEDSFSTYNVIQLFGFLKLFHI